MDREEEKLACDCNFRRDPVCLNCGLPQYSELAARGSQSKTDEVSTLPELETFPYTNELKIDISRLYQQVTGGKTKRNAPRRAAIYCCIVIISKQQNLVFDSDELRGSLNLKERDINRAMKEIEPLVGVGQSCIRVALEDIFKTIIKTYDLNEEILSELVAIYDRCSRVSKLFISSRLETLAAGIVFYYLSAASESFDQDRYFQHSRISRDTIVSTAAEITRILA